MNKRNQGRGSGSMHGPYVDGLASVLAVAMRRTGRGQSGSAVLLASRPLSGPNDGGPAEVICGVQGFGPGRVSVLELNDEEREVAARILAESLEDPTFEIWSDLVVAIKQGPGGIATTFMPSAVSRLQNASDVAAREKYLSAPALSRLQNMLDMTQGR